MITVIDSIKDDSLTLLKSDIFGLRVEACLNAYGTKQKFLQFFEQRDFYGSPTAVISSLNGDVTLCLTDKADFEEIEQFIGAAGGSTVFFDKKYDEFFHFKIKENGSVMRLNRQLVGALKTENEADYKKLFNLIFDEPDKVDFSLWFTDLSHKIRHSAADMKVITENGEPIACAIAVFETKKAALLGAVTVKKEYRNKGFGTAVVEAICEKMQSENRSVFLCRENNKNELFYSRMGFENCGEWTMAGI